MQGCKRGQRTYGQVPRHRGSESLVRASDINTADEEVSYRHGGWQSTGVHPEVGVIDTVVEKESRGRESHLGIGSFTV